MSVHASASAFSEEASCTRAAQLFGLARGMCLHFSGRQDCGFMFARLCLGEQQVCLY